MGHVAYLYFFPFMTLLVEGGSSDDVGTLGSGAAEAEADDGVGSDGPLRSSCGGGSMESGGGMTNWRS